MWDLSSDVNITPKKILRYQKTPSEIDIGNTIEYDMKSNQVETNIVNFMRYDK